MLGSALLATLAYLQRAPPALLSRARAAHEQGRLLARSSMDPAALIDARTVDGAAVKTKSLIVCAEERYFCKNETRTLRCRLYSVLACSAVFSGVLRWRVPAVRWYIVL